jgi:hypothetical protein
VWNCEKENGGQVERRGDEQGDKKKGVEKSAAARINRFEKREIILLFVYTFTLYNNLLSPSL